MTSGEMMQGVRASTAACVLLAGIAFASPGSADEPFEYAEDELAFTLNPLHESSMAETRLNELIFESLWGPGYDGAPEPRLADAYEVSEDKKAITIYLRENVSWSDGQKFTSEDVVFTIKAYQHPKTASPDRSRLAFVKKAEERGEFTVKVTFVAPEPNPLEKFYFKIIPAHRFDSPAVERSNPFWYKPIGTGPYKLATQDIGTWSLLPNKRALRTPQIRTVKVREMPDKNQQVSSLGYGYIQAMVNVPAQYLAEVERSRNADLIPYQGKSWWYLGFNTKHRVLKEVAVRSALARALDLDAALELIGEGYRISGPFVPSSKFYNHSETIPLVRQDTLESAELMKQAGFSDETGKWTNKKGEPLTLRLFYRSGMGEAGQTVALNLQSQLRRFGVQASDPVAMDKAVWNEKVFVAREFDIVLDSWSFDENENIYDLFHSSGTQNFIAYKSKKVDELLAKAVVETDPTAKVAYMKEVHRLLAQDQPYVFLWTLRNFTALRREVESVFVQPFYYFSQFPDWRMVPSDG
jgi:peptide/nickel transport system substrate-binding protein